MELLLAEDSTVRDRARGLPVATPGLLCRSLGLRRLPNQVRQALIAAPRQGGDAQRHDLSGPGLNLGPERAQPESYGSAPPGSGVPRVGPSVDPDHMDIVVPDRTGADLLAEYDPILPEHRAWLSQHEAWRRARWEALLSQQPEAAILEALVRRVLELAAVSVAPHEDQHLGGPDFTCNDGAFFVEATCITIQTARRETHLEDRSLQGGAIGMLTGQIATEVGEKSVQFAGRVARPLLVVVGTLHVNASWMCMTADRVADVLQGTGVICIPINMKTGAASGPAQVLQDPSATPFVVTDTGAASPLDTWRRTVSAVLTLGLAAIRPESGGADVMRSVTGLLHPEPHHPFDRQLLPSIRFLRLDDGWLQGRAVIVEA